MSFHEDFILILICLCFYALALWLIIATFTDGDD